MSPEMPQPPNEPLLPRSREVAPLALRGIFVLLVFYTLYFTASLVLPIYIAFLLSLALSPLVRGLNRFLIPYPVGAAIVVVLFLTVSGYTTFALSGPAAEWMAKAPSSFAQIERRLRVVKRPLEQVTKATESVEDMTNVDAAKDTTPTVQLSQPSLAQTLLVGTRTFLGQTFLVLVLLYFLLASKGDLFHKLASALPRAKGQPGAEDFVLHVESEISRYLLSICVINSGLALAVAAAMFFLSMPNPLLWGAVAGILNFIPFIGAICSTAILTIVSLLTFDSLAHAAVAPIVFVFITSFEGFFVTPAFVGQRLTLSPIAILLALLFWSWIWGPAGALIAVPTLAILKILCDRIPRLSTIATLIGP